MMHIHCNNEIESTVHSGPSPDPDPSMGRSPWLSSIRDVDSNL